MSILQGRVFPLCYVYLFKHGCFIVEALLQQRSENIGLRTAPSGSYRAEFTVFVITVNFLKARTFGMKSLGLIVWDDIS